MKKLIQNIKTFYLNLHLQTKLLLTYLIIISIPMILIAVFLYGKVYDMIVADTIRNEQQESSKTCLLYTSFVTLFSFVFLLLFDCM